MHRYAVYFVPRPGDPLARLGESWLGYDLETQTVHDRRDLCDLPESVLHEITAQPARYGFHATLKAPFFLAPGCTWDGLREAAAALAARLEPLPLPRLMLDLLDGFYALVPSEPSAALEALAQACVEGLDRFRAPLGDQGRARRMAVGLTPRQEVLLERWGYPYVAEAFRFHMTLTTRLDAETALRVGRTLERLVAPCLEMPACLRDLCLCGEPETGAPFQVVERLPLTGKAK